MSGKVELLIFPESFRKLGEKAKLEIPVLIRGGVRVEDGSNAKLTVNDIIRLGFPFGDKTLAADVQLLPSASTLTTCGQWNSPACRPTPPKRLIS